MRVNKALSRLGLASRRRADELIAEGRVRVDGQTAAVGQTLQVGQELMVDGKAVSLDRLEQRARVWMHHKAPGTLVSAEDGEGRPCVVAELQRRLGRNHLIPVGMGGQSFLWVRAHV